MHWLVPVHVCVQAARVPSASISSLSAMSVSTLSDVTLVPPRSPPAPPSPPTALRVAVIGSGASGSAATKACLEGGVLPTCFELQPQAGGIWRYAEEQGALSSVYRSTVINTSKELSAFSDFPIPEAYPTYMHHQYMLTYIRSYRAHFDLDAYTRYGTRVLSVRQVRRDSVPASEQHALPPVNKSAVAATVIDRVWRVESEQVETGARTVAYFNGVMVCTGHHSTPHEVTFPGQELFQGRILHSHSYKDERPFAHQNVCVVGVGNSGVDIAVELSRHCSSTILSTRSGVWIFPRLGLGGRPLDHILVTRFMQYAIPGWIKGWLLESLCRLLSGDMTEVGLTPHHRLLSAHQTTNAELVPRIRTGMLTVKRNILRFTREGVVFADEPDVVRPMDAVILATGYDIALPFLQDEPQLLHEVLHRDNRWNAYKFVFPLKHEYQTVGFIEFMQPQGATNPIVEMQSRWYVSVLTGATSLPSLAVMQKHFQQEQQRIASRFTDRPRHRMQVDYIPYMDTLATEIGAVPSALWELLRLHPRVAWSLLFDPAIPAQYRLNGPHRWPLAATLITQTRYPARSARSTLWAVWGGTVLACLATAAGIAGVIGARKVALSFANK